MSGAVKSAPRKLADDELPQRRPEETEHGNYEPEQNDLTFTGHCEFGKKFFALVVELVIWHVVIHEAWPTS